MQEITRNLNPPQQEAVFTTEGPVLVLAGAGSGKTRALTCRIAYLIEEKGVDPWHILAITFTNKAAREMKSRVTAMTPEGGSVFVSTFHAACVRILRAFADRLGYGRDFTIYDGDDQKLLMRGIIKEKNLDPKKYPEKEMLRLISALKDEVVTAEAYTESAVKYSDRMLAGLYQAYQKKLMLANAMDFDDLLVNTVRLFEENEDVLEQYRNRFRYILVDEYQDTNTAQFRFVELLARKHRNLCVVGDDDQSIYKFRGANIGNILNFEDSFPGARVIRLEQNYRSTKNILAAANQVIRNNTGRKDKTLWSDGPEGDRPVLREYPEASEEARGIARDILKEKARYPYGACAVLYRTNGQSRLLEESFVRNGIPYRLIGGTNFYERREVKDILAYLKTVENGCDDLAVRRILNVPRRGIGDATAERIGALAAEEGLTFLEGIREAAERPELRRSAAKLRDFLQLIDGFRALKEELRVCELIDRILVLSGYQTALQEEEDAIEAEARLENIRELINKAADYPDEPGDARALGRFLEEVALVADADAYEADENRVVLMTLHSAKGLEFPKVYIAGMEENLFPGARALFSGDPSDLEEERRLCYVGFTRAKERLILTAARSRMVNGRTEAHCLSRFIEEIDPELLKREGRGLMDTPGESRARQERTEYGRGFYSYEDEPQLGFEETQARRQRGGGWKEFSGGGVPFGTAGRPEKAFSGTETAYTAAGFGRSPESMAQNTAEAAALKPGDRVLSKRFGEGTVVAVEPGKRDVSVTVDFDRFGRKKMMAAFAAFTKL